MLQLKETEVADIREHGSALAVLIDADNANPAIVEGLLAEIAKLGFASVKRIYGDWTTPNLSQWKTALLEHSIQPIQQFAYTTGKNATDSAMIIDAMDLLYAGNFDGFCLVSSDSDFTRLASRIRESGKIVYGFGEQKTPRPFVTACDRFIYTEVFAASSTTEQSVKRKSRQELRQDTKLLNLLRSAIEAASDENGWSNLGPVGYNIIKQAPDFDPRNYGYTKLSDLLTAIALFKTERRENVVFVKNERPA
ncbi:MAG: NYN domain-containing protein [Dehalococcoidia bacterium]|nr:NYN domain-containing protein [Dehalococcoidia bacterium]